MAKIILLLQLFAQLVSRSSVLVYNLDTLSIFVYIPPNGCAPEKAVIIFKGTIGGFGLVADSNFDSDLELSFGYQVQCLCLPGIPGPL